MPLVRKIFVSGGDRPSLMQFALIAQLIETEPETDRGVPKVPASLAGRTQTWFTRQIYRPKSLLGPEGRAFLSELEASTPRVEQALTRLRMALTAAQSPSDVAGTNLGDIWPTIRRLPTYRHPIDLIVAGSAAVESLYEHGATERDRQAIDHLQKGLCEIALGFHQESAQAFNLLSILGWWQSRRIELSIGDLRSMPMGGRLARVLDRTLRTFADPEVRPKFDGNTDAREKRYHDLLQTAVKRTLISIRQPHHAMSASAPLLRLARICMLNSNGDKWVVQRLLLALQAVAKEKTFSDPLARREALWYLKEMSGLQSHTSHDDLMPLRQLEEDLGRENPELFLDIVEYDVGQFTRESPRQAFHDLNFESTLNITTWPVQAETKTLLMRHLPLDDNRRGPWRALPVQVAQPAKQLLQEMLAMPSTGRLWSISEAFLAAGSKLRETALKSLRAMLKDQDVVHSEILARRVVRTLGVLWSVGDDLGVIDDALLLLLEQNHKEGFDADVVWCLTDILGALRRSSDKSDDISSAALRISTSLRTVIKDACEDPDSVSYDRLVTVQAAVHCIGLTREAGVGDLLADSATHFQSASTRFGDAKEAADGERMGHEYRRAEAIAIWSIKQLDSPITPTTARW